MTSPFKKAMSERNKSRDAALRVEILEKNIHNLNERINMLAEVVRAAAEVAGHEAVEQRIQENRLKVAQENLQKAIADGTAIPTDKVANGTLLVIQETTSDGKTSTAQVPIELIEEAFRAKLIGQSVGAVVETLNGGKAEVLAAYEFPAKGEWEAGPVKPLPVGLAL